MRIFFVLLLILFSCSKKQIKFEVAPVVKTIADEQRPIFHLGMSFGDTLKVEPVFAPMAVWEPTEEAVKRLLVTDKLVVLHDTTIVPTYIKSVHYDTITVQKIVHSRGLAYLMLVMGFVCGILFCLCFTVRINKALIRKLPIIQSYIK